MFTTTHLWPCPSERNVIAMKALVVYESMFRATQSRLLALSQTDSVNRLMYN
jgi:hypothetical protein